MRRLRALLTTRFGAAVLACLVLAGWALWSSGIFDGPIAQQVRTSPTWTAPSYGVDRAAADAIIGNRRLVVVVQADNSESPGDICGDLDSAADGTVALILTPDDEGRLRSYGCQYLFDGDISGNFGRAALIETIIGRGVDEYAERPLDALKVAVVNYDLLVTMDRIPQGTRTIDPSLPRLVIALVAIGAVVLGSVGLWVTARRAGRATARRRADLQTGDDARSVLSARLAGVAQLIIDLDGRPPGLRPPTGSPVRSRKRTGGAPKPPSAPTQQEFHREYLALVADYTALMADVTDADAADAAAAPKDRSHAGELADRAEDLERKARQLQDVGTTAEQA